ncbi:hypothetical protein P4909_03240 [Escherichia coli]
MVLNNRHINLDFYIIADVYNDAFFSKSCKACRAIPIKNHVI